MGPSYQLPPRFIHVDSKRMWGIGMRGSRSGRFVAGGLPKVLGKIPCTRHSAYFNYIMTDGDLFPGCCRDGLTVLLTLLSSSDPGLS
jgi:hypothetical protein